MGAIPCGSWQVLNATAKYRHYDCNGIPKSTPFRCSEGYLRQKLCENNAAPSCGGASLVDFAHCGSRWKFACVVRTKICAESDTCGMTGKMIRWPCSPASKHDGASRAGYDLTFARESGVAKQNNNLEAWNSRPKFTGFQNGHLNMFSECRRGFSRLMVAFLLFRTIAH